ncbi:MAG: LysR family transcriptional regulator [Chloroflexota bacterium]|nr:LysR family transcriptional regulator [Chloroflexota bacterium]
MADINFHQLLLFYTVARVKSFSRAAQELGVSQPAVSIQVQELERSLGTVLLNRKPRGVEATEAGRTVYEYAQRIFSLTQEMQGAVDELQGLRRGRLTLGASSTPGDFILPLIVAQFAQVHPGIQIELLIANTATTVDRVLRRELHMGVVGEVVEDETGELFTMPLIEDEVAFIASPRHPLAQPSYLGVGLTLEEVATAGLVMRESGSATRAAVERCLHEAGVRPQIVAEMGSNQAVKQATAAGLGIGAVSRYGVCTEVAAGTLLVLPVKGWRCTRTFTIIYLKDRHLSPVQRAFLQFLKRMAPDLAPAPVGA